ncbi:hypothetical protein [Paraburkholderia sp. EG304]|uniref:hypothetical protein n=1 Tax=Paraburkholderia sp. EG304 TaxID=3237015 RepID=UPI00397C745F
MPSEHSSGGNRRLGRIVRTGYSYAGKLLVVAGWSYRHPARVSPKIQARLEGLPKAIINRAWDAEAPPAPTIPAADSARSRSTSRSWLAPANWQHSCGTSVRVTLREQPTNMRAPPHVPPWPRCRKEGR